MANAKKKLPPVTARTHKRCGGCNETVPAADVRGGGLCVGCRAQAAFVRRCWEDLNRHALARHPRVFRLVPPQKQNPE